MPDRTPGPPPGGAGAAALQAAEHLARPERWRHTGTDGRALWGETVGRGGTPYRTRVDTNGPAFTCSCPARVAPCRHALGLLLLQAEHPQALPTGTAPADVARWIAGRDRPTRGAAAPDVAAQERRAAARAAKVAAGVEELSAWLDDLVRDGLARAPARRPETWERAAARMVDAQAPGLAGRVRAMADTARAGRDDWPSRLAEQVGGLHLLLRAHGRLEALDAPLAETVDTWLGRPVAKERVLAGPGIDDRWDVVGRMVDVGERLVTAKTYLWGRASRRWAVVVDHAPGEIPPPPLPLGTTADAGVVPYPGAATLRALVRTVRWTEPSAEPPAAAPTLEAGSDAMARALAADPWTVAVPLAFAGLVVVAPSAGGAWHVRDAEGAVAELDRRTADPPALLAAGGGQPCTLAGEWDGETLRPFAAWCGDAVLRW